MPNSYMHFPFIIMIIHEKLKKDDINLNIENKKKHFLVTFRNILHDIFLKLLMDIFKFYQFSVIYFKTGAIMHSQILQIKRKFPL